MKRFCIVVLLVTAFAVACTHKSAPSEPFYSLNGLNKPTDFQGLRRGQSWAEANVALKAHGFPELSPIDDVVPFNNADASFDNLMIEGKRQSGYIHTGFNEGKLVWVNVDAFDDSVKKAYLAQQEAAAQPKAQPAEKMKCFTIGGVFQITAGMSREELDGHFKDTPFPSLSCTKELNQSGEVMLDCVTGGMTDDGLVGWEFMIEGGVSKLSIERFPASKYSVLYKAATKAFGKPTTTGKLATWDNPLASAIGASCSDSLQLALNGREADLIVTDLSN